MSRPSLLFKFAPPIAAAVILSAMLLFSGSAPFRPSPQAEGYLKAVALKIDAVPHQAGAWLGVDIPTTPAAVELLQPNRIIQRRYTNAQTGESFELLIVHCGDVRDMIGHYPPVCYPAHGWKLADRRRIPVTVEGNDIEASSYRFTREVEIETQSIVVTNLFAVPIAEDSPFGPDLNLIEQAGRSRARARLGAAQVQIITPPDMTDARRAEIVSTALRLVDDVLTSVAEGPAQ